MNKIVNQLGNCKSIGYKCCVRNRIRGVIIIKSQLVIFLVGPTPLSKLPDMDLAGSVQKLNPHFLMSKRGTTGL